MRLLIKIQLNRIPVFAMKAKQKRRAGLEAASRYSSISAWSTLLVLYFPVLRRSYVRAVLDDELFVVKCAVSVDIDLNVEFVFLTRLVFHGKIVAQAVLTS